jgi:hypothetical protein
MSNDFSLESLTRGIRERHIGNSNALLVEKWNRTGLLRGLADVEQEGMSRLLENQAAQLLREQNALSTGGGSMSSSGNVTGFSNIAFPIVRRVFGGLVSNELVSVQPMSLPSGLLFYLDYTYGTSVGGDVNLSTGAAGDAEANTYTKGNSIYNNPAGKGVRSGSLATGGMYDLAGAGYSRVHGVTAEGSAGEKLVCLASGAFASANTLTAGNKCHATGSDGRLIQFDPQISRLIEEDSSLGGTGQFQFLVFDLTALNSSNIDLDAAKEFSLFSKDLGEANHANLTDLTTLKPVPESIQGGQNIFNVRRLNQVGKFVNGTFTADPLVTTSTTNAAILTVVTGTYNGTGGDDVNPAPALTASFALAPSVSVDSGIGSTLTIPAFESNFGTTPSPAIPDIDIKVESIAVTAITRKLRARWSPELAQDLNAYHSLDAEVELTQILSEQIALEIDREILNDLLTQANGANLYWSRSPGKFVNKETGAEVTRASSLTPGPAFTGTVREWYETLTETIIDCANTIHRKTLRGSANFIVTSPDVSTILEASVYYKPSYKVDGNGQVSNPMTMGAEAVGTLSNRFTVYKDPYFPRNKVLVGYKGGSYLETGYVYAPYVPLIVTPTIFAPEDFTPRKGVMTRYGKKMVRSDFYGTVTVMDLNII